MEGTSRIPKPGVTGIKPPSKIAAPVRTGAVPKILPPAKETNTIPKMPPQAKSFLRRRSKSVTDLRGASAKPLFIKPSAKPLPAKTAPKRPLAASNTNEPTKAKAAKIKIPDWDYKSRFHDLQQKFGMVQGELKDSKTKLTDLATTEERLTTLSVENTTLHEQVNTLQKLCADLKEQNSSLSSENNTFKESISYFEKKQSELEEKVSYLENLTLGLKSANGNLTAENETFKKSLDSLRNEHADLLVERDDFLQQNQRLLEKDSQQQSQIQALETENENFRSENLKLQDQVRTLTEDLEEQEALRRVLHNAIQDLKGNIRVFCRIRPPINEEEHGKNQYTVVHLDETSFEIPRPVLHQKQEFTFDKVFPQEAQQLEVFEELSQLVQSALDGYDVCVFAYGQTGSGKTFTMQGTPQQRGMIPRTIDLIFERIDKLRNSGWTYTVTASFLEIYNEVVKDLLAPTSTCTCEIRFNEGRGITVTNLKIVSISSATELKGVMDKALKNRAVAATDFNEQSSRSHAVTKIHLKGHNKLSNLTYKGSINLVDLAGSESAKTSSTERLTETKNINKSLSTLGNVMLALHNKDTHVPYRDSKLTFLLRSCLGGNSKTLMFVNIAPFEECYNESVSSLRFASKVKEVKTSAKKNKTYRNV